MNNHKQFMNKKLQNLKKCKKKLMKNQINKITYQLIIRIKYNLINRKKSN